ncbi:hypothetical protein VDF71_19450 [Xanthomonas campestris pv. raphani]|uniref:hypothetical protein n=1 Tax=Xanthomonas campestris TaxID=339 RepID=UPI002B22E721|nr:hypothetical protein [Xanthomonas campestris]MEA9773400.1 hypothetical protein [Xanthomonas campestris pv. raphani]MEA9801570.1 hypothetical protein [Xanthomonas campestris pv. raphani]
MDNTLDCFGDFGLTKVRAAQMIDDLVSAVRSWSEVFEEFAAPAKNCDAVASAFRRAGDIGMKEFEKYLLTRFAALIFTLLQKSMVHDAASRSRTLHSKD